MSIKIEDNYQYVETEMLERIFLLQNPSNMRRCNDHMIEQLIDIAPDDITVVKRRGNVLMRKGKPSGPHPYFLAHLDQVHDYAPMMELAIENYKGGGELLCAYDANDRECGVGGDDKCGIYLAMLMLHRLDHVTVVFVRDEEVGCEGSADVPLSWFKHAAFVIQSDRNNTTMDIIGDTNGMNCASVTFLDEMCSLTTAIEHGHTTNTGSITDVGELASRGLEISMVNISSGYHMAHTASEYVDLRQLDVSIALAHEAAQKLGDRKWKHKPTSSWQSFSKRKNYSWGGSSRYDSAFSPSSPVQKALATLDAQEIEEFTLDDAPCFVNHESYTRDEVIDGLEEYGYDRNFDALDHFDDGDLIACVRDIGFTIKIERAPLSYAASDEES